MRVNYSPQELEAIDAADPNREYAIAYLTDDGMLVGIRQQLSLDTAIFWANEEKHSGNEFSIKRLRIVSRPKQTEWEVIPFLNQGGTK